MVSAVMLLYVVYALFYTNLSSDSKAQTIAGELEKAFDVAPGAENLVSPQIMELGAYALLYIPALGNDVMGTPILLGTSDEQLAAGVGQYLDSELPGEAGNLSLAGHRATNGEPFARFERLRPGDEVIVRTQEGWFVYTLVADRKIGAEEIWVIDDNPGVPSLNSDRLLTLTTCHPRWNSTQRWAWWGEFQFFSQVSPMGVVSN